MKFPPSKQARWPDVSMVSWPSNAAKKVSSGREAGLEARNSMVLSAAAIQLDSD
jgi:hypothetical protein